MRQKIIRININKLKQLVRNGPYVHPGANLIRMQDGFAKSLAFGDREKAAKNKDTSQLFSIRGLLSNPFFSS